VTSFRLALAAAATAVTAVGLASAAHGEPDNQFFQDPSGKIKCEVALSYKGDPYANCTVRNSAYAVPEDACQFSSAAPQFGLTQGHAPTLTCVAAFGEYQWPTLDVGQTRSVGTITCDSETSGVKCSDAGTGHVFRISTDSYDLS
jgi:hypothetical protein